MTLHLIPKILDSFDLMSSVFEESGIVYPHMMKVARVERIVGFERIGVNNAPECYFFLDDRQQSIGPFSRDNGSENLTAPLKQAKHGHFTGCSSTSLTFASDSEVTFISLNFHTQLETGKLACNKTTKVHEKMVAVLRRTTSISEVFLAVAPATSILSKFICLRGLSQLLLVYILSPYFYSLARTASYLVLWNPLQIPYLKK